VQKGDSTDEAEVQQWFDVLTAMLPEVAAVAVDAFLTPIKGVSAVFGQIAAKKQSGT
jgi:hypothetical protein